MTDRELEGRLRACTRGGRRRRGRPITLRRDVAAIPQEATRRGRRLGRGRIWLLAAAVLLVGGAAAAGSGLLRLSPPVPPQPAPSLAIVSTPRPAEESSRPTTAPTPVASAAPRPAALIAFIRTTEKSTNGGNCGPEPAPTCPTPRVWVVGSDGTGAHELLPDGSGNQFWPVWSPDGTLLLYSEDGKLYLTDAGGGEPALADTGCVAPCGSDYDASFSTDGTKLVFTRNRDGGSLLIATMDLDSGQVTELRSTEIDSVGGPSWSPDGRQIAFTRDGDKDLGGPTAPRKDAVFVVDADGRNLRQISPSTLGVHSRGWSPDGSRIVLTSAQDIYTIRPDGSDLRLLTTDGISSAASWTPDGRILFVRGSGGAGDGGSPGIWTMDADGSNAAELMPLTVAQATPGDFEYFSPAWQPAGGASIGAPPWRPAPGTAVGPPPPTPPATPPPAMASGFTRTGSMTIAVEGFGGDQATRLADGRVLVLHSCETTAELYDPTTGTFSATGSMIAMRGGQTATLLGDGRVLVTGGDSCGEGDRAGIWASAELYDPATGTFSQTGSMSRPRTSHDATLLPDGHVLITGGTTGQSPLASGAVVLASYRTAATNAEVLASAELFDPATGTFSRTGSMGTPRVNHTATLLLGGRVLVVGGGDEGFDSLRSAELYDPATGRFRVTDSMNSRRWIHTATLLGDGRVLIAGGRSPKDTTFASAEIYDPGSGAFTQTGSMHSGRWSHTATLLPDGRVLIAGGYESDGGRNWQVLSATELYDAGSGTFSPNGSMGEARDAHTATLLVDGRVLIAGGIDIRSGGGVVLTSAVLYQP
jgi:Tol biopolymer transport system component